MSIVAPIINQSRTAIRFQVDDVLLCENLWLTQQNGKAQLEQRIDTPLIAFSHDSNFQVVEPSKNSVLEDDIHLHPLVKAVHMAFSSHRPLLLTPDVIWMVIAQGFAQHVNNNAEKLRQSLVVHPEKITLKTHTRELSSPQHWAELVNQWAFLMGEYVNLDIYELMQCDFSTTTPTIRTASQVVMMDAFKQYFDYLALCSCGIPWVELRGTEADWCKIRDRVQVLGQFDLDWWTEKLLIICDEFIATIQGQPHREFWQSIYKPEIVYAAEVITGWLGYLFPYTKDYVTSTYTVKNPMFTGEKIQNIFATIDCGVMTDYLPNGLSQVDFVLKQKEDDREQEEVELIAGFIGVCQHQENGSLYAEIGWGVRQNQFLQILQTLKASHNLQPPISSSKDFLKEYPKEILQMLDIFDGGTLYTGSEHPWKIRSVSEYHYFYEMIDSDESSFYQFIDLKDDRAIAYKPKRCRSGNQEDGTNKSYFEWWVVVCKPILTVVNENNPDSFHITFADTKVIATSIPQFFERLLAAKGQYYFDAPDFVSDRLFDSGSRSVSLHLEQ